MSSRPRRALARHAAALAFVLMAPPHSLFAEGISDNSFFIEEAYNQEAGVVQHIQTALWTWDREGAGTAHSFAYGFTQEWPLGGTRHQISYTIPIERRYGSFAGAGGLGDVQIHYRLQALEEGSRRPAVAPRVTVILPTGEDREGLGAGVLGFQGNLPVSKKVGSLLHLHANAGVTAFPGSRSALPGGGLTPQRDLLSANLGASAILLLRDDAHLMLELVRSVEESLDDSGDVRTDRMDLLAPGARYALNSAGGMQWVLGGAYAIGLNEERDDAGVLLYLSIEHSFR